MAFIHRTTLTPTKLELLDSWLPTRPWYLGGGSPDLAKAGGFRLDDPEGAVGIEFMVVNDVSGDRPVSYHVPFAYRGEPLDGVGDALIGTAEHGELGRRWIYDGTRDPVVVAALFAFMLGRTEAQAQSVSDTPDPTVTGYFAEEGRTASIASASATDAPHGTDVALRVTDESRPRAFDLHVRRVLQAPLDELESRFLGHVTAGWRLPDGTEARDMLATLHEPAAG